MFGKVGSWFEGFINTVHLNKEVRRMKRAAIFFIAIILAMCWQTGAIAAEKVTVYTSLETDETVKYLEAARRDMPDLEIDIIRLSTGELGARMLAEKDNHQADLVWGWAVTT